MWEEPGTANKNCSTFSSRIRLQAKSRATVENNGKSRAPAGSEVESECQKVGLTGKQNDIWKPLLCPAFLPAGAIGFLSLNPSPNPKPNRGRTNVFPEKNVRVGLGGGAKPTDRMGLRRSLSQCQVLCVNLVCLEAFKPS